ncbi:MAG: nitrite/sulfite reductase [Gammaproteobacteria bacterium]
MSSWKERLAGQLPAGLEEEIDVFETQIELRKQNKVEEKLFAETRLRRGVYGQRYDNGQRHDGITSQTINFPCGNLTKGPDTMWDAPGMMRIKIPFGGMTPEQMDVLADVAEEYSDMICHVTTRQDIQLHFVHIDDTPDLMRRLAAVHITTREACGNSVRNVTGCPIAGVCNDESFDITPYADACYRFLLGHPDVQDFGRKFKVSFSGCKQHACGLANMHDLGLIARKKIVDGEEKRGFEMYVGGGLGAVPYDAKLLDEFVPEEEIFPLTQAVARVFTRLGEKRNRGRARIKFLVDKLGIDEFRKLVLEERKTLQHDDRWTDYLKGLPACRETPLRPPEKLQTGDADTAFAAWRSTNVYAQKQEGYAVSTVSLPLGDITSWQMRELADIARKFVGVTVRTTVDQNIVLRWVAEADLPDLYKELQRIGLGDAGAGAIVDVTACPGTDTCKLGISSSRGLASELKKRLAARFLDMDAAIQDLHIKISGCFNSCGQHHLADLGFYGVSRKVSGRTVPHFRVVLGGEWANNAGSYGMTIGAVPSRRIPDFIDEITRKYLEERDRDETFQDYTRRVGKKELKKLVDKLAAVPPYELDKRYYSDWDDPREYTISDIGVGECAGEVISRFDFDLESAERQYFEAQLFYEDSDYVRADEFAYKAMIEAARGLVRTRFLDVANEPDIIVDEFKTRFYGNGIFQDKFAEYLFNRHQEKDHRITQDKARHIIEETQLFIEAVHACNLRLSQKAAKSAVNPPQQSAA